MFISNLTSKQQSIFLGLAKQLIESDGNLAQDEINLLTTIQQQMATIVPPSTHVEFDTLTTVFDCNKSRASLLLELLGLAHADQNFHATEKNFIKKVAIACGVSDTELQDMDAWVVRQLALVREAAQFMEG